MSWEMHELKEKLYERYGTYCWHCGVKFDKNYLTGHHVVMKSKGGKVSEDNIVIVCQNCHFGFINHIPYDSPEYWEVMRKIWNWKASHEHSE